MTSRDLRRILAFGTLAAVVSCRRPSPAEESYVRTIEQWRSGRIGRLTKPDGWLSLAGLFWLKSGENSVGSDRSNDVVLPASTPARAGTIVLVGQTTRWERASNSSADAPKATPLVSDGAGDPTILRFGGVSFLVHQVGERVAVRVRDSDSATRRDFKGIKHFPVSSEWRFEGRFIPFVPPKHVSVPTVLGYPEDDLAPGEIEFVHRGKTYRLTAVLEQGADQLFVIFGDRTNGKSTYGGGRFVYAPMPRDGRTVLDFNKAYNPPCVFTPYATCPLPPPPNHLPMEVTAGEKMYAESWELKPRA
jgi:uncharacterized protein (DUF1684 family)